MSPSDSEPGPRIVDVVFDRRRRISRFLPAALVAVSTGYAAAGAAIIHWTPTDHQSTDKAVVTELAIEIGGAVPPPPVLEPPAPEPPRASTTPRAPKSVRVSPPGTSAPVAFDRPAPVAATAASARDTPGPVDLTDSVLIVGKTSGSGGGTAIAAPSAAIGGTGDVGSEPATAATAATGRPSHARPVALEHSQWRCPWPGQAENAEREAEDVLIKVVVASDGRAVSAVVLRDPGLGFGEAAVQCALTTQFVPALNGNGTKVRAESPPIRVRFTR